MTEREMNKGRLEDTKHSVHAKLIGVPYGSFAHSYLTVEYLVGESKPNYPMPALRNKVQFKWHSKGRLVLGLYEASNTLGLWFCTHIFAYKT